MRVRLGIASEGHDAVVMEAYAITWRSEDATLCISSHNADYVLRGGLLDTMVEIYMKDAFNTGVLDLKHITSFEVIQKENEPEVRYFGEDPFAF